jgi:hypothetical protein
MNMHRIAIDDAQPGLTGKSSAGHNQVEGACSSAWYRTVAAEFQLGRRWAGGIIAARCGRNPPTKEGTPSRISAGVAIPHLPPTGQAAKQDLPMTRLAPRPALSPIDPLPDKLS